MDEDMVRRVENFLKKHVYCTIATCSKGTPLATVVVYVSRGLDIFFFTGEGTKKLKDIRLNPMVAVTVQGRRLFFFPQAVEIQGKAEILSGWEAEATGDIYFSKRKLEILAAKKVSEMADIKWVKVTPVKVFTYGIGTRPWHLTPEKQFKKVL